MIPSNTSHDHLLHLGNMMVGRAMDHLAEAVEDAARLPDPHAARVCADRLADTLLAAEAAGTTRTIGSTIVTVAINWGGFGKGDIQDRQLGLYVGAPPEDHPEDEFVFYWLHIGDLRALLNGHDVSGDGWRLALGTD